MPSRRERARLFVRGLVKFVALVAVAGGCGVAIGYGLSRVSDDKAVSGSVASGDSQTTATATSTVTQPATTATRPATTATTPATTATTPAQTTTATTPRTPTATVRTPATTAAAARPFRHVNVRVLGAILRPAGTPDGRRRRRARLTMRVQAVNNGDTPVTVGRPVLAVGKVRIGTDTAARTADPELGHVAAKATKAATLRFELAGDATEKITIDRRARINIAGRSLPFRLTVGSPVRPPATTP